MSKREPLNVGDTVYNADGEEAVIKAIDGGYCWVKFTEMGTYYTWPIDAPRRRPPPRLASLKTELKVTQN